MNKKIISIILAIVAIALIVAGFYNGKKSYSKILQDIVVRFNKSSVVDVYKTAGSQISASSDSKHINIVLINSNNVKNEFAIVLDGSILSLDIDLKDKLMFDKLFVAIEIFDIIGQINGYKEGDLAKTLNSDKANEYTLKKEGFELKKSSTKYQLKIDLEKKVPLLDFSNVYFEPSDLDNLKEFINSDGSAEKSKGNVWFNKSGYDGKYTVLVAEKKELTSNTYKSLLSIFEVMFGDYKVVNYFKENYPSGSFYDKTFDGFELKVNPIDKTSREETLIPSDSGYKFIRISIDKEKAILAAGKNGSETSVKEITYLDLEKKLQNKDSFILEIIRDGCSPCESFAPKFEKILAEYKLEAFSIDLVKLSETDSSNLLNSYNIVGTPTVMFFQAGKEGLISTRINGNVSENIIISNLKAAGYIK